MLSERLEFKKSNRPSFQVLYLRNDASQKVEVDEVNEVDFFTVQERLEKGESVFITSKSTQKLNAPKGKNRVSRLKTRLVTAFYFDHE